MTGTTAKSLRIQYFASFREARGLNEETIQSSAATAADLYDEMASRHGFKTERSVMRVALNDRIVPWTTPVCDGDTVVFLTPFGGG